MDQREAPSGLFAKIEYLTPADGFNCMCRTVGRQLVNLSGLRTRISIVLERQTSGRLNHDIPGHEGKRGHADGMESPTSLLFRAQSRVVDWSFFLHDQGMIFLETGNKIVEGEMQERLIKYVIQYRLSQLAMVTDMQPVVLRAAVNENPASSSSTSLTSTVSGVLR